jgi:folate-binding protein YgfZ
MTRDSASDAARSGALLVSERRREILSVTGPDRVTWLNGVVTCDIAKVSPTQAAFGLLLTKIGKIQTEFYVLADDASLQLACAPGTGEETLAAFERMLVMEDAELARPPNELACLSLHGPRSLEFVTALRLPPGSSAGALDRTGLGGAVLLVPGAEVGAVERALAQAGVVPASEEDWQQLRIERNIGVFGTDYGPNDNPHEAGVERRAIAWNKGCYLGQEVVFMQDARGKVKRRSVELVVDGPVPAPGAAVTTPEAEPVGDVTSAAASGMHGGAVALARVKVPYYEPGTALVVGGAPAVVRAEPI